MFKINNEKIGKHLGDLIKNSEHKNDRQFCIAYLTLRDRLYYQCHQRNRIFYTCRSTVPY